MVSNVRTNVNNDLKMTFNLGVSDKELKQELTQEFTDLELPLDLIDKCIKEGYLIYDGYHVSIVDIK